MQRTRPPPSSRRKYSGVSPQGEGQSPLPPLATQHSTGNMHPMTSDPRLTPIATILPPTVPFVGPETQERQRDAPFAARLGANESGFGPSPRAIAAIQTAASEAWMYGDPEGFELRHALAAHHGIAPGNVVLGEGIDGLLGTLTRLYVAPGDAVVTSAGAYPTFNYHVAGSGGALHTVPYRNDAEDIDALVTKAAETGAKLVYFANPDNPMGSWLPACAILDALDRLPDTCLLVLDEAYADTSPADAIPALDMADTRLIRMRTFSKAHGLAGLRAGYALGAASVIGQFEKMRNHFGMGRVTQAGALAALQDQAYLEDTVARIAAARERINGIARAHGLSPLPSATNFVTIDCGRDGDFARKVLSGLIARGIFVRMPGVAPLDRCIRVSVGPEDALLAFEAALPGALAVAAG